MVDERTNSWRRYRLFGIVGIVVGVVLLHPAAMFIMDYSDPGRHFHWTALQIAFSSQHIPMIIFFGVLGVFIGILYAILNTRLSNSVKRIKMLEGILPICCVCKRIRDDDTGELEPPRWVDVEAYISSKTDVDFSHTYCPKCYEQAMAEME
ncbi:hypothetical protein [Desulfobacula sp.]|uniref:hypothetical protein n=1 Tax=Desulfobacula sp. TaxID=2593537 RepID=UPI00261F23D2|nr:hypothetical protein [Desulfobacula sp.]